MGLSSSQARLLSLTTRMHQIEYKAAKLEAQKLQMANESRRVYDEYLEALDSTKIQTATLNSNGAIDYVDATWANLIGNNISGKKYDLISTKTGDKFIPDDVKAAFKTCNNIDDFMEIFGITNRDYISISSAADLMALNGKTVSGNYRLTSDITINNSDGWAGINLTGGTFDGNGHSITFNSTDCGMFNRVKNSTVKNLYIDAVLQETEYPWDPVYNEYLYGAALIYSGLAATANNSNFINCDVSVDSDLGGEIYAVGGFGNPSGNNFSYVNGSLYNNGPYTTLICSNNSSIDHCSLSGFSYCYTHYCADYEGTFVVGNNNVVTNCNSWFDLAVKKDEHEYSTQAMVFGRNNSVSNCYLDMVGVLACDYDGVQTGVESASYPIDTSFTMPAQTYTEDELEKFYNIMAGGSDVFTNLINSGEVIIQETTVKPDGIFDIHETSVAINTGLREVSDETLLRKAEAKYEADMRKIDAKDRKYDTDLAALDAERNAIKSEIETLKTVAKDNVERTFKLFS